jgi:hypothetical protein
MLDAGNWSEGVTATVAAVNDAIDDDLQYCEIRTARTSSDDGKYDDLYVRDVDVWVEDDDEAGIDVLPPTLAISEPDGFGVLTLTLASQPTALVTIGLSAPGDECMVSPASVDLDAGNWSSGVTATVTAEDDDLEDGTQTCLVLTEPASSLDAKYLGRDAADVEVTVYDDDIIYRVYLPAIARRWPPVPDVPTLYSIDNADGNGTYTASWSDVPQADSYILEEATDSTFSDATVIYSGASTSFVVAQRGAARYYYRVKARNSWGDSGWSAVRQVDVRWEAEPNNQPSQANGPIVSGLTYFGTFPSPADSRDYFTFKLSSPHQIELWLTNIAAGQNYDLVLRNAALSLKGYSGNLGNSNEHILTGVLPAGTYYIQVYRNPNSSGGSSQAYHLKAVYE